MGCCGGGGKSSEEIAADKDFNRMQMEAYERQRQSNLDIATMNAKAGIDIANANMQGQIAASKNSAIGAVIGSALGANTTHEEIKQMLPSEVQSEFIRSWDLAQKWNKTIEMRTAGYQDVAIEYELSGKNYKPLFNDSQWNALEMMRKTKGDMIQNARIFGIKSPTNPGGVDISASMWEKLHSFKDPSEMLKVDPEVAARRNAMYDEWAQGMRDKGMGLIVDIYENPQLGGSSILTMKGKDPLLDPALAPLLKEMMGQEAPTIQSGNFKMPSSNLPPLSSGSSSKRSGPDPSVLGIGQSKGADPAILGIGKGGKADASILGISGGSASKDIGKKAQDMATNMGLRGPFHHPTGSGSGGLLASGGSGGGSDTDWDSVINALTKGEENKYTGEIKKYMEEGLIDKYGMVSPGALMKYIPPELLEAPEFNMFRNLSTEDKMRLTDDYDKYATLNVDPKMIQEHTIGFGVNQRIKLNPDGSIAHTAVEGEMYDRMGNPVFVSMQGSRLQEFYDRQSMINGLGPLFPGIMAPVTDRELSGRFEPGFWGKNVLAKPNMGMPGQPNQYQPASKALQPKMAHASSGTSASLYGGKEGQSQPKTKTAGQLGQNLSGGSSSPSGYEGAPLAAGE